MASPKAEAMQSRHGPVHITKIMKSPYSILSEEEEEEELAKILFDSKIQTGIDSYNVLAPNACSLSEHKQNSK